MLNWMEITGKTNLLVMKSKINTLRHNNAHMRKWFGHHWLGYAAYEAPRHYLNQQWQIVKLNTNTCGAKPFPIYKNVNKECFHCAFQIFHNFFSCSVHIFQFNLVLVFVLLISNHFNMAFLWTLIPKASSKRLFRAKIDISGFCRSIK